MKALGIFRDSLKKYYADYDLIIRPLVKFLTALSFLILLKNYIGYNELAMKPAVILGASAVCALFPYGCITLISCLFVLANMYSVSLSFFLISAVLSVFVVFLYFGFRPGHALAIVLVPVAFLLKIPYSIPVILGMLIGLGALMPVLIGVVFWFLIDLFHTIAPSLELTTDISALISEFLSISQKLTGDRMLYITLIAFALGIGVACILKKLSFDHVWTVSVIVSLLTVSLTIFTAGYIADAELDTKEILIYTLLSLPIVLIFVAFFYQVDYKATERLQFEDDDYYYYVKAVPKIVSETDSPEDYTR